MEPVIETKGLKHVYIDSDNNPVTALDGIDLQIMPGEFVAVIGANGSGKSTLARHFNALLLPSAERKRKQRGTLSRMPVSGAGNAQRSVRRAVLLQTASRM